MMIIIVAYAMILYAEIQATKPCERNDNCTFGSLCSNGWCGCLATAAVYDSQTGKCGKVSTLPLSVSLHT